ncbi:MAG: hypothetical protein GF368_03195 [Candidatus Aenigmarchaeota archaeon]|nr:hypothetical protein [Candidatus Aenigmarchaeota archaeon]
MSKKDKKSKISKPVAIILIILMLGSTIGMFASIFLNPEEEVELPNNKIIKYRLTEAQVKKLIGDPRYKTVIEYEYPSGCLECANLLNNLEYFTMNSENQIYLQEIQKDGISSSKLTVTSLRGQEILYNPTTEEALDIICELIISSPLFCLNLGG